MNLYRFNGDDANLNNCFYYVLSETPSEAIEHLKGAGCWDRVYYSDMNDVVKVDLWRSRGTIIMGDRIK